MKKHIGLSSQGHVCHSIFYLNSFISTYEWMRIKVVLMKDTCNSFRVNSQIVLQLLEISGLDCLKRQNSNLISTLPRFDCTLQIRVKLWLFWTVLQVSFVPFLLRSWLIFSSLSYLFYVSCWNQRAKFLKVWDKLVAETFVQFKFCFVHFFFGNREELRSYFGKTV